jgi:hypothetical protein
MGPYSHIILANELETYIKPDDPQEYYWGAIAPDIRYLVAGMNRSQTHISPEEIREYMGQYPHLKPFLQGYLVHCLSDKLDLPNIIQQKLPLYWQNNELTSQDCTIILEFFNIVRVKTVRKSLSGTYNIALNEMGISEEQAAKFAQEINQYITSPSFASLLTLYQNLGSASNGRIDKYRIAVQQVQRKWFQKNLILIGLHVGKMNKEITSSVKSVFPNDFLDDKQSTAKYVD